MLPLPRRIASRIAHGISRWALLPVLVLTLALAGCSSLGLAYNQLPLLGGLWLDRYLDLDRPQQARLREQLRAWQAWHRREELPHWQALLRQAQAALDDGTVTPDELLALERGARASLERCLQHAAPLAAPVLADLRPAQWQHLERTLDDKTAEWLAQQNGPASDRASRYVSALERWLGDLDRTTRRHARAEAEGWRPDVPALAQARAVRQARTLDALRAWAHHDGPGGTALLLRNSQTLPQEMPHREELIASLLRVFNQMDARQREAVRRHWADWTGDLARLQQPG
ncbi:DUF6279 family lipoprotein [Roseateles sp. BYS87W]|uniref:DUF6279 family lipoprotein n=1 Tax=Pelomonas baiyunensis TaxID=3299026 RepID=A0ABW7H073_9BURK